MLNKRNFNEFRVTGVNKPKISPSVYLPYRKMYNCEYLQTLNISGLQQMNGTVPLVCLM